MFCISQEGSGFLTCKVFVAKVWNNLVITDWGWVIWWECKGRDWLY